MQKSPPVLLAATFAAAWLLPAFAQAPTSPTGAQRTVASRTASGPVREMPMASVPVEIVHGVQATAGDTRASTQPAATEVAQATIVTPPQPQAPSRPEAVPAQPRGTTAQPAGRPRAAAASVPSGQQVAAANGTSQNQAPPPCNSVTVEPATTLALGKSQVVRLPFPVARVIVGGRPSNYGGRPVPQAEPGAGGVPGMGGLPGRAAASPQGAYDGMAEADVNLLSPTELFFLARRPGSMNVVLQGNDGRCIVKDLLVTIDPSVLQSKLLELLPGETGIQVRGADHSMVLTGTVTDSVKLDQVMSLASAYGEGRKVVNLLRVTAPQQVMLEVTIAEVSKTLLDRFGIDFTRLVTSAGGARTSIISGLLGGVPGVLGRFGPNTAGGTIAGNAAGTVSSDIAAATAGVTTGSRGATLLGADMQKRDGIIRVLAEPNIMAITGQAASFLSGGKIFIPVAQTALGGFTTITLEEKEFGVGLKFTPTVLDGRINLKVLSEVSELSQTGTPFTTVGGTTAVLPSLSTRRVDTTVQLADGQSFVVAGLIKNNFTEALNKFPGLGEVPVVGALFRSSEFQNDQTELMFVVTPRLVKPIVTAVTLPTDNHVVPSRGDVILRGSGEGRDPVPAPVPAVPAAPATPAAPMTPAAPAALAPPASPAAPTSRAFVQPGLVHAQH